MTRAKQFQRALDYQNDNSSHIDQRKSADQILAHLAQLDRHAELQKQDQIATDLAFVKFGALVSVAFLFIIAFVNSLQF